MTREEAKATINEILGCFGNKAADGEYELTQLDAEDMREAIERLSVVECEDAISRADAISLFKDDVAAVNELMQLESVHPKVCECEDAISRKSVIDVLTRNRVHFCDMVRITSELKELPTVTPKVVECEDAISRQATVERLCKVAEFMNEKRDGLGSPYVMAALFIQDNKDEFPSVTPQQKMGRWIKEKKHHKDDFQEFDYWDVRCSECGARKRIVWTNIRHCPMCGAKMAESEETE